MENNTFLAFDLGATSGRGVLITVDGTKLTMKTVHQFPNQILELNGKYYWNIYSIYEELKKAIKISLKETTKITSIGIDTWGVDFGYIAEDGTILGMPRAYRDPYTNNMPECFSEELSLEILYDKTGIQIMPFNTIFQLYSAKRTGYVPFKSSRELLFIPDLLAYMFTGKRVCEVTDASTSQLLNPVTRQFDEDLLEIVGLDKHSFNPIIEPGTVMGSLTQTLAEELDCKPIDVISVAGHDTASAVLAVPAEDKNFAYISSGTWSLIGIETEAPIINEASRKANFTNEGGVEGTTRFLKNITGMWILEQCKKEWQEKDVVLSYASMVEMAKTASAFESIINPDDTEFMCPDSMIKAIEKYCITTQQEVPHSIEQFLFCIFNSLAHRYAEILKVLKQLAPFEINQLHIIGGGSRNAFLNQLTADVTGLQVIAGPSECTALGNGMIQAKAAGIFKNRWEIRHFIRENFQLEVFNPSKKN